MDLFERTRFKWILRDFIEFLTFEARLAILLEIFDFGFEDFRDFAGFIEILTGILGGKSQSNFKSKPRQFDFDLTQSRSIDSF